MRGRQSFTLRTGRRIHSFIAMHTHVSAGCCWSAGDINTIPRGRRAGGPARARERLGSDAKAVA